MSNFTKNMNKFFKNKTVLYILFAIGVFNLLGYLAKNNIMAVTLFLLIGYISTFFTKNMSYIILVPILLTNFFVCCTMITKLRLKEGLENQDENNAEQEQEQVEETEDTSDEPKGVKTEKQSNNKVSTNKPNYASLNENDPTENDDELTPVEAKIKTQETMENTYQNLEKMLGSDKIQKMSDGAKNIADNQKELYSAIEKMGPMMTEANKLIDKLHESPIGGFMKKFT